MLMYIRRETTVSEETVQCPFGCGAWIPLTELNNHEALHQVCEEAKKRKIKGKSV